MTLIIAAFKVSSMAEENTQSEAPGEETGETIAYFDPAYREDIAENKAGRLSERQYKFVANWGYEIPPEEKDQVLDALEHQKPDRSGLALIFFLGGLSLVVLDLIVSSGVKSWLPVIGLWGMALFQFIPKALSNSEVEQLYKAETAARRKRFRTEDSARKIIRLEGTPDYETPSAVTMDGVAYSVERPLWQWLREHSQHVAVYAVEGWYPRHALSVEPLDVPIPE